MADQWDFDSFYWKITDNLPLTLASAYKEPQIKPSDIAFLQYTSGSTGEPKGVMISHENLLQNLKFINECYTARPESVCLIWLPPYHDMGLIGGILYPIYTGIPVYLMSPITFLRNPSIWLHAISKYRATVTSAPNFAYALCNQKISSQQKEGLDLSSMHAFLNGAEPISLKVLQEFTNNFSNYGFKEDMFFPCYGLAESTLMVSGKQKIKINYYSKKALHNNKVLPIKKEDIDSHPLVSCGSLSNGIFIVDPNSSELCDDCVIGEIWIANPSVAQGYWNRAIETNHSFCSQITSDEGRKYLRTGDLGFSHNNELFVVGRLKDLIIINGTNHYPQDIETSIDLSHPEIRQGCSAAVSIEANEQEKLAIIAEVKVGATAETMQEIISAIRKVILENHSLSVYQIALIKARRLPKTTSGKIKRNFTKIALINNQLPILAQWSLEVEKDSEIELEDRSRTTQPTDFSRDLRKKIRNELGDVLNIDSSSIEDQQSFADLGLDSLMAIELENRLQSYLKNICQLDMATVINHPSIDTLATYIESMVHNKNNIKLKK